MYLNKTIDMTNNILHLAICFIVSLYSTEVAVGCALTKEWCDTAVYGANDKAECIDDLIYGVEPPTE